MRSRKFELTTGADFMKTAIVPRDCRASIEPFHLVEQTPKPGIVCRERRQPFADSFAFPPRLLPDRREPIPVKSHSNVMRRRIRKRIIRQERECAAIVVQKFPDKTQRPRIIGG